MDISIFHHSDGKGGGLGLHLDLMEGFSLWALRMSFFAPGLLGECMGRIFLAVSWDPPYVSEEVHHGQ